MAPKAMPSRAKKKYSYSADRPIIKEKDDLLGRAMFARSLANDICAWGGHDSLVIALYGGWGSGKTSLKNLILTHLSKGRTKIAVMEFNPWQFSGTGNIASAFFTELGIALRGIDEGSESAARGEKLERYAKRLSIGGSTAEAIGAVLSLIGVPGGGLAKLAGEQLKKMANVTQEGGEALKSDGPKNSLLDLKRDLGESLAMLVKPTLVVIDDIDRLTTDEVREVLQLVKANADFPNLIYLLLCERSIVAGALDGISGGRGSEFLEKIVQVGYDVPQVSRESLQRVLFGGLDRCLGQPGVQTRWQAERWSELYRGGFASYFQNLRHVYRFLASFDFHIRQFQKGRQFEVNPLDLIALEALRVFDPSVYERLPAAKRILTRDEGLQISNEIEQNVVDAAVTQLISHASKSRREQVRTILGVVFPPINSTFSDKYAVGSQKPEWLRQARVCHRDLFEKYFTLVVAENDLSQTELDRLVEFAGDRAKFVTECEALNNRGLLVTAFERLDAFNTEIAPATLPSLIRALCDLCDTILASEKYWDPFSSRDTATVAWRLVYFGLRREKDVAKRFEILRDAFTDSPGIFLPTEITSLDKRESQRDNVGYEYLVSEEDQKKLATICVQKIRNAARDGVLRSHVRSEALLWRWRDWATENEVRGWLAQECEKPEGAAWLLSCLMGRASSGSEVRYYIQLSAIAEYADIDVLEGSLASVDENDLTEKEQIAVKEFRRAVKRRNDGKPEPDGYRRFQDED
ncbi:MAG: P-loop NTPase fold protein [Chthoniobacter sp.]|nr:P-loop NTPase fold protein [Chthoniobacter sp.]